jgi:hypothetical protein
MTHDADVSDLKRVAPGFRPDNAPLPSLVLRRQTACSIAWVRGDTEHVLEAALGYLYGDRM